MWRTAFLLAFLALLLCGCLVTLTGGGAAAPPSDPQYGATGGGPEGFPTPQLFDVGRSF